MDGGAGSNFLAGGAATVWGVSSSTVTLSWADNAGAPGHTGLTLHARTAGGASASLTLVGFKQADLSGRLSTQFGLNASSGSSFLTIHGLA